MNAFSLLDVTCVNVLSDQLRTPCRHRRVVLPFADPRVRAIESGSPGVYELLRVVEGSKIHRRVHLI